MFQESTLITLYNSLIYVAVLSVSIKAYNYLTTGVCTCKNWMGGKVVLVTGAESGKTHE